MMSENAPLPRPVRLAKFSVPLPNPDLLRRPRLLDFLQEHVHRKLILVAAAAGYGKSSLLADFVADTEYRAAWLRLDETDRDLAALAPDLVEALQRTFPSFQSDLHQLTSEAKVSPEEQAATLNREMEAALDEYFVLVLDDFHLVEESPPVIRFFDALLADLPEQAHLCLVGRTIPPLRLATLTARQQIAGLSEEHLRFTAAEAQALVELRNRVALPDAEAEKLVANTEGWITGILLTTHLMWQGLMARLIEARQSEGPLYDYLVSEVLDQQPALLQQFLLESSVLPDMEPTVCDVVLGRSDSADRLRQVVSRRLFVSVVGDDFRVYQYHALFRDFLVARLRAVDLDRLQALQSRAAEWYAANGMAEAAVTFYLLAGQLARAADVAEAKAEALFTAGRHDTLRRWADQLAPMAQDTPLLHLFLSIADGDAGSLTAAEQALDIAAAGFAHRADEVGVVRAEIQRSLLLYRRGEFGRALTIAQSAVAKAQALNRPASEALALRYAGFCLYASGNLSAAEEVLSRAVELLGAPPHRYNLALTLGDLALVLRAQGQTARAARVQQQALAIWRERSAPGPLALALNNIGWDLHMLGQYESALSTYREALDWARRAGSARSEVLILTGQADVLADTGERSSAADLYRQAMAKAEQVGDWARITYLCRAQARLDRWSGNFVAALEWLRRASLAAGQGKAEAPLANLDSLRGITLVEMGHLAEGRGVLEAACVDLERSGALVDLAQTILYRACAEFRADEVEACANSLARALDIAEQVGYDQMLLSEAGPAREALQACAHRPGIGPRVAGLLARADAVTAVNGRSRRSSDAPAVTAAEPFVLRVRALGPSRVLKADTEISRGEWTQLKIRELFFFLVDRAPVPRDTVLEVFWPDMALARATNNFYQTLFRLRRTVGCALIDLGAQICRLTPDLTLDYDVARFETEAEDALSLAPGDLHRLGALASATDSYGGDYLADLPVEWASKRRRELTDLHVSVLAAYADELMNLTRYAEARGVLARALAAEPLRDDLHGRMLVCLAGLGRRHAVVDYYRRYREMLRTDLGLDPPSEIRALYSHLIE